MHCFYLTFPAAECASSRFLRGKPTDKNCMTSRIPVNVSRHCVWNFREKKSFKCVFYSCFSTRHVTGYVMKTFQISLKESALQALLNRWLVNNKWPRLHWLHIVYAAVKHTEEEMKGNFTRPAHVRSPEHIALDEVIWSENTGRLLTFWRWSKWLLTHLCCSSSFRIMKQNLFFFFSRCICSHSWQRKHKVTSPPHHWYANLVKKRRTTKRARVHDDQWEIL